MPIDPCRFLYEFELPWKEGSEKLKFSRSYGLTWNDGKVTQVWRNISKGSDVRHVHVPTGRRPSDPKNFLDPAYSEKASPTATKFSTVTHVGSSVSIGHRRRKRGVCMGSDTPTIYVGILICITPRKPNT